MELQLSSPESSNLILSIAPSKLASVAESQRLRQHRIMVVDDEEFCLESIKVLLKKAEVDMSLVDFCITGEEALRTVMK